MEEVLNFLVTSMMVVGLMVGSELCTKNTKRNASLADKKGIYKFKDASGKLDTEVICGKEWSRVMLMEGEQKYKCADLVLVRESVKSELQLGVHWLQEMLPISKPDAQADNQEGVGAGSNSDDKGFEHGQNGARENFDINDENVEDNKDKNNDTLYDTYKERKIKKDTNETYLLTFAVANCKFFSDDAPEHILLWWSAVQMISPLERSNSSKHDSAKTAFFSFKFVPSRYDVYIELESMCMNNHFDLFVFLFRLPASLSILDRIHSYDTVDYFRMLEHYALCEQVIALNYYKLVLTSLFGFLDEDYTEEPEDYNYYPANFEYKMPSQVADGLKGSGRRWFETCVWSIVICLISQ